MPEKPAESADCAAVSAVCAAAFWACCWRPRACPPFFAASRRWAVEPDALERRDEVVELLPDEEERLAEEEPRERAEEPALRLEEDERPPEDLPREVPPELVLPDFGPELELPDLEPPDLEAELALRDFEAALAPPDFEAELRDPELELRDFAEPELDLGAESELLALDPESRAAVRDDRPPDLDEPEEPPLPAREPLLCAMVVPSSVAS